MSKRRAVTRWLPWRFGLFLLLTLSIPALLSVLDPLQAILSGFDVAALGFMATMPSLFKGSTAAQMRAHSRDNDANRGLALLLTVATSLVILVAVALELSGDPSPVEKAAIVATLLIAWTFSNLVFALHYAHIYYIKSGDADRGGATFPGDDEPTYWDFAYFAFTLGMTFQTSDVSITRGDWRRLVLWHSLAAFVFNLGILAFTINTLAGK